MRISRFVIIFERDGMHFLYNTCTQSFFKISDIDYESISKVLDGKANVNDLSEELVCLLEDKHCIDTDNEQSATSFLTKMEYRKRFESFSSRTLSLVIAPTLACNFACPYCYEANLPISIMNEEVEDDIIRFIKSYEKVCDKIEICWEGGEPLIGFDTIKSLYEKIETETPLKIKEHIIVTNGYLLTPEICNFFKEKKLDLAQITIDGNPDTHNKSRVLKSGGPTYDTIMRNIDMLTEMIPTCKIIVRTNIHNGNKNEYGELYRQLTNHWEGKNVVISPVFVLENDNCKVSCCSPREKTDFYLQLQKNYQVNQFNTAPKIQVGRCSATAEHSYIIDPKGNLYKCWNDIGIEKYCIGNVAEGIKNNDIIAKYVVGSDKYTDNNCRDCKLFPICGGGCNRRRIDNRESGMDYNLCSFDEDGLCDRLYEYYKSRKKMRVNMIMLLLLSVTNAVAQNLQGKVTDEDGNPIGFANVVLLTPDSTFIDGTVTTDSGDFLFHSAPANGDGYRLRVSSIGYEPFSKIFGNGDNPGTIRMRRQTNELSEIVVTPPEYKMKGNGLMVSIQNSSLSHMEDIGKMLDYLPGLQSTSGGLYVFGKGTPLVYLNGRILSDMSELERLRPSDIATVEIIRNPGATYSASSQAVVRIKTIRKQGDGLSADLITYFQLARRTRFGETLQTNYRAEKFDVFAYLKYMRADDYASEDSRYDIKSENPFSLNSTQKNYDLKKQYMGKVGFDYYFTQRQSIGLYYSYDYHTIDASRDENVSVIEKEETTDDQTYRSQAGLTLPSHRVNAYYSGHMGPVDISFNNDLYWSENKQSQSVDGESGIHGAQNAATANTLKNRLAASDLTLTYRRGINTWEIGTAYNYIHRTNDYKSEGGIELDEFQKIRENKWAVYADYQLSLDKWQIDAGLRYELYRYDYYKNNIHIDGQSKVYRNVYPGLSIYHPAGNVDLSFSYSSKSRKPDYNALDGNVMYISRNLYSGGNPQLKPSTTHDLQLMMLYRGLIVSADYIVTRNPIYFTYRFYDDDHTVILSSYDNYPKVNIFQAEVSYSRSFGLWKPQITVDFLKSDYRFEQAGRTYKLDSPLVSIDFNHTFSLPGQYYLYLITRYTTGGCNEYGLRMKNTGRISLYAVKKWGDFTVGVLLNDITRSLRDAYSAISPDCTFHTSRYMDTQNLQINIRYTFNATRSKYKGTDAAAEEFNRMSK